MKDKEELQAKLNQRYRDLLKDVKFHEEGLKFNFAEEVSKCLDEQGISRAELARRMGTSPAWVTKMLRTDWNMTMETMAKVAFYMGMEIEPKFVPIQSTASRFEYYEEHCWAEMPLDSAIKEAEIEFPYEESLKPKTFQPFLEEGIDFESIPTYEEAKVA